MVFPTSEHPANVAHLALAKRRAPSIALHAGEALATGIPRIAIDQLDWMLFQLRKQPDRDLGVHQARKSAKRLRGVLRLVRDELGYFRYRQENVVLRDTARRLSPVRSSAVLVESVDHLLAAGRDPLPAESTMRLRAKLEERHVSTAASVFEHPQLMTDVVVTLLTARSRYAAWPTSYADRISGHPDVRALRDSWDAIGPGIHRTYRRGQRAMSQAVAERTIHNMHAWRKRAKYLWYQLSVLQNMRPEVIVPMVDDLDALGEALGAEHDYAELGELIAAEPSFVPDPHQRFQYLTAIVAQRMELQALAVRRGARMFDETPGAFVARLGIHFGRSRLRPS